VPDARYFLVSRVWLLCPATGPHGAGVGGASSHHPTEEDPGQNDPVCRSRAGPEITQLCGLDRLQWSGTPGGDAPLLRGEPTPMLRHVFTRHPRRRSGAPAP